MSAEPSLSRDGSLLVYASDNDGQGHFDLWVQRVSGGTPVKLTHDPGDDRQPDVSPDGSAVAFRSERNEGGVYVMPVLGGDSMALQP